MLQEKIISKYNIKEIEKNSNERMIKMNIDDEKKVFLLVVSGWRATFMPNYL